MEGRKLLQDFKSGKHSEIKQEVVVKDEKPAWRIIPKVPSNYNTTALILAKMMVSAWIAQQIAKLTGINAAVVALFIGIVLTEVGFLDPDSLNLAKSYGFLMFTLMIFVFAGLKDTTPEILMAAIGPMAIIIVLGVSGLCIASIIVGKILGLSWNMACAVSLTALYGFPPNYILTMESIKALVQTEEEEKYLTDRMLPQMIVGGFVTVTITSVIVAGYFVKLF